MHWLLKGKRAGLLAVACMLVARGSPLAAKPDNGLKPVVIYSNDFEKPPGPEWSNQKTDITPKGERRFLGQFGNDVLSLKLKNLPNHKYLRVSFELFIIHSWDGDAKEAGVGPDIWSLKVKDGPQLLYTTFTEHPASPSRKQTFPDDYPGPRYPRRTGAAEVETLGYTFGQPDTRDAVYRLSFLFSHTAADVTLFFAGSGLEALPNESWGLDNVKLEAFAEAPYAELKGKELQKLWEDLAGPDPIKAFEAIWELAGAGDKAVELLDKRLAQVKPVDDKQLPRLIQQLDDREWAVRESATKELTAMGKVIEPILREVLESQPTPPPETRYRIREILQSLSSGASPAHPVCFDRAIRVLQAQASWRAWQALEHLSARAPFPSAREKALAALPEFRQLEELESGGLRLNVRAKSKWRPSGWGSNPSIPKAKNYSTEIRDDAIRFRIDDSDRQKVWIRYFKVPVDYKRYPILVLRYRARNMAKEGDYNIWMDDGAGPNGGGFVPVRVRQLVADGETHEIRRDIREFKPRGLITGLALGIWSSERPPGTYDLISLHFEAAPKAEPVEVPSEE